MKYKFYIGLILCCAWMALLVLPANGANSNLSERTTAMHMWRAVDGLPSDSVTAIIQTRDGFIWIGTDAGLVRFDGVKFTTIKLNVSTNNSLHITALCQDSNGYLWVGTQQNGLFELLAGQIRHFTKQNGLVDNDVTSLAADSQGLVWVGSKSGLNIRVGNVFDSFTVRDGLPDAYVAGVNVARSGTVWITTHAGMCRFINGRIVPYAFQTESQGRRPEYLGAYEDRRGNLWAFGDTYLINLTEGKRFNYFRSSESASVRIWSLCEGQDGRLWIGTSGRGLFCFEDNRFQPVILDKDHWPYDVRAICEDDEGNLWLGTAGGGLIQLRPQSVYNLRAEQGLPDGVVTAMTSDINGRVYIGMERGGLFVNDSGRFDAVENGDTLGIQNYISSLCAARDGTIWAGTLGAGLYGLRNGREIHLTTADGLANDNVSAVCSDRNGGIWFSAGAGSVYHFTGSALTHYGPADGLPASQVTVMLPSTSGGLWLGTRDGQILHEDHGSFDNLDADEIVGHNTVLSLYEGKRGQLWIGTAGGGLSRLSGGAGINWNTTNGLPSDDVEGVVEDDDENLWVATEAGIYRINYDDIRKSLADTHVPVTCELIARSKTVVNSPIISGGTRAILSTDGLLWFATSEGVLNVDAHNSGIIRRAFPVYIESAVFNGTMAVSLLKGAIWSWPASNNAPFQAPVHLQSLEIHYTAPDFSSPEDIQFRYKLEGNDADWADDAGNHYARYGHLPYGHYRFRVQACGPDGEWIEASQPFAFVVPTPLYSQTWVLYVYGLTAVALIAGIVRVVSHRRLRITLARLEQQQSLERERMRIARDMHDEIGSKLTKISFLSERVQVDEKNGAPLTQKIDSIAETSRELLKTMDEIVWVVNPRNDTLENLTTYLAHYAVEYFQNTAIECELRIPREVSLYPLSSETRHHLFLAFEEALNNVLKHSGAKKVKVEMIVSAKEFELKITDDGKGFDIGASDVTGHTRGGRGGNGLKNMRQRLAAVGGDCVISSSPGKGTVTVMHIPLITKTIT